jgi:hypothetical protein
MAKLEAELVVAGDEASRDEVALREGRKQQVGCSSCSCWSLVED